MPERGGKTARPVHPSAGLEAMYRARLDREIGAMHRSLLYWLKAAYRANEPEITADESPAKALQAALRRLAGRWSKRFAELADREARTFVKGAAAHADRSFSQALKDAGFTVPFRMTKAVNDVVQAAVAENVGLIKSIAAQHLTQVEGLVMRSVQQGRDLSSLTEELEKRYAVTRRRAAFIARDQNNKATANINRARQLQIGAARGVWLHSAGGKTARRTHLAANGTEYDLAKGWWDPAVKKFILPGELPNCRCRSRTIIPALAKAAA